MTNEQKLAWSERFGTLGGFGLFSLLIYCIFTDPTISTLNAFGLTAFLLYVTYSFGKALNDSDSY